VSATVQKLLKNQWLLSFKVNHDTFLVPARQQLHVTSKFEISPAVPKKTIPTELVF
jgi:hypothetical protein